MSDPIPKPVFLIPPGSISKRDIRRIEKSGMVIVAECSNAGGARFLDPPPLAVSLDARAAAAYELFRFIQHHSNSQFYKSEIVKWFVDILLREQKIEKVKTVKS